MLESGVGLEVFEVSEPKLVTLRESNYRSVVDALRMIADSIEANDESPMVFAWARIDGTPSNFTVQVGSCGPRSDVFETMAALNFGVMEMDRIIREG